MADAWLSWLALLLGAFALLVAFGALRGASRLQRRLFLLFLLLSWLPTLGVSLVQWQLGGRHAQLLDSPGVRDTREAALQLARIASDDFLAAAQARVDSVAQGDVKAVRPLDALWSLGDAGELRALGGVASRLEAPQVDATGPRRRQLGDGYYAVASAKSGMGATLVLAVPFDPALDDLLRRIADGSGRLRQVGFYYARLLRMDTMWSVLGLGALFALGSLMLSRALAQRIGGPLAELTQGTRRVASGDLGHEIRVHAVDELATLVEDFNSMSRELSAGRENLRRSERIAAWQSIARRLAHEIKNPLTPIHLSIHRMRSRVEDPAAVECLDTILEETENLRRLADEFSLFAKLPQPSPQEVDARELLAQVVALYHRRESVRIEWAAWPQDSNVWADEGQLRQLLGNLVKNAFEAMGESGCLELGACIEGDVLAVEILDDGLGLPEDSERIFDADFTTKSSGTGLGLAICRKIADDHGARIGARRRASGGSGFLLEWPRREGAVEES